jgi:hypothetical protein
MRTLTLTSEQIGLIQSALYCVTKSGGGSATLSLYHAIERQSGVSHDLEDVIRFANIVISEAREAGEI